MAPLEDCWSMRRDDDWSPMMVLLPAAGTPPPDALRLERLRKDRLLTKLVEPSYNCYAYRANARYT